MKKKRKITTVLQIILGLAITLSIGAGLLCLNTARVVYRELKEDVERNKQRRVQLLCQTDHQALLEACNELSRRADNGELNPRKYSLRKFDSDPELDADPEVLQFPTPILNLSPNFVYVEENGRVILEMYGGLYHYGVVAYTEDYNEPFNFGDRELVDKLWYYDDGYENPEYYKTIDELIQKGFNEE